MTAGQRAANLGRAFELRTNAIIDRLETGLPLRVSELADFTGYDPDTIRKFMDDGILEVVGLGRGRMIPVRSAVKALRDLKLLPDESAESAESVK